MGNFRSQKGRTQGQSMGRTMWVAPPEVPLAYRPAWSRPCGPLLGNGTPQGGDESGSVQAKFCPVLQGELPQHLFTLWSQGKPYFTAVFPAAIAPDIASDREPVHQLNRTVMSNLQPLGQLSNPWADASRQPFQGKHELMLMRLKTSHAGSLLTEVKKTANLMTQFRQRLVVSQAKGLFHAAKYIVSRLVAGSGPKIGPNSRRRTRPRPQRTRQFLLIENRRLAREPGAHHRQRSSLG